jgi:hypothetical protein
VRSFWCFSVFFIYVPYMPADLRSTAKLCRKVKIPPTTTILLTPLNYLGIYIRSPCLVIPPAYLKVHTASCHFLESGKIRRFACSLIFLWRCLGPEWTLRSPREPGNPEFELNLEDKGRAENRICFQKAYFLSSLVQIHFSIIQNKGILEDTMRYEFSELSGSRGLAVSIGNAPLPNFYISSQNSS